MFGPGAVDFGGSEARGLRWSHDGQYLLQRARGELQKVDPFTGDAEPAYDLEALRAALRTQEGIGEGAARRLASRPTLLSDDHSRALFDHADRLYLYRFSESTLAELAGEAEGRRLFTFSPDLAHVAFVRDNDLYAVPTTGGAPRQLTDDGSDTLLNGVLDWVYQEEIYGRGQWRAYWWSPDSRHIAYLQLDESRVPTYTIVDNTDTLTE